ncbi:PTS ascorbate transporter subunit IIA [Staphylococcus muscae]|uniref:Ascorbate-specific PTS system EIIA component n=1 Tax=Staphylococcus muscae TaxID=1294 RepID=A0A240CBW4_9STAP|nr:PTS sugar transporter subunit IIA [Staphylococcus muscae]AVQ33946.1 PTS ascorbate transporter subunit IIA [Staphylococcus muscae]PNZ05971.1 PTS ascorbate transporter subunit IIA [Staphylococcus muscae]GGA83037.1 PTS ascorbate transporter subunit IIA [Staphylococcus muscae]SNW04726.1 PTS system, IIA component [Staphylococcus muscae]
MPEMIQTSHIQLQDRVTDWEEAIRVAAQPLREDGYFEQSYVDAMINSVHEMGPYIVIAPEIAIAHARPSEDVHKVGLSLLKLEEHINFSETGRYATLVFVLSAVDEAAHLDVLRNLAMRLSDTNTVEALMAAQSKEAIKQLLEERD